MKDGRPLGGLRSRLNKHARGLSWLAIVPILVLLVWFASSGRQTLNEIRVASQRAVRVAELRETITYLNEWLSAVSQVAVLTGERRWADRYEEVAPKLDDAISEAVALATPTGRAALASTMGEAHRDLATMERRAIASAAAGDRSSAQALLNGPEYAYLQDVYDNGSNIFGQQLAEIGNKQAADLDVRTWLETLGIGLGAVLLGATALSISSRTRLQGALAVTTAAARTDALTLLPNRRRFHEVLEAALAEGRRVGLDHALLMIDLDRFKAVNDAFGHPAGDDLLQSAAARLRSALGDERFIARLGGDEFAFILRCDPEKPDIPRVDPAAVADRIVSALSAPFILSGGTAVQIGASVGIAISCPGDDGVGELMHRADVALYRAKADGRGCCRVYTAGMHAHARAKAMLDEDLHPPISEDRRLRA
ncbi:GGDEF domain-containing protein [Lichenifustis flavocetrariae]|uniref:GGDEF domain-containing protein n=1 Tax=Lichenifustis flavocetrariae TaxID=2949735 RepID=A0AA41Z920_9HYPH|nr:GGDEF domain-containing protein [Lichenifustis flavocetrariae]MCW6512743.1 GGDEF domain-containing protein [Lichenifustis flavocetrariae]